MPSVTSGFIHSLHRRDEQLYALRETAMNERRHPAEHREAPVSLLPTRIIRTWPVGTFIENLCVLGEGSIVVSVHSAQTLEHVKTDGTSTVLARMPMPATGLIAADGGVYACGGTIGTPTGYLWYIGLDGSVREWLRIDEAVFLNGLTPMRSGVALTVDSLLGTIYEIDVEARTARRWFQHEQLTKCSDEPMLPGVNGIKVFDGKVFVTNTDRALILAIPINPDGSAGELDIVAEGLRGDDIAFDALGNLYATTHIHNSLIRLGPDGERAVIAGPEEGMPGATSCAFGRREVDGDHLYVTTTGGIIMPFQGKPQEAKLVQIAVGMRGFELPTL